MLKLVTPALVLAVFAGAVLAAPAGVTVRLRTPEVASVCKLAPGFQSAHLWQQALSQETRDDDDAYVREVLSDAKSVHSAVERFKAALQDHALAEMAAKQVFLPGRLTLSGCTNYAVNEAVDGAGNEPIFPAPLWQ